jgi:hypothetical protein
MLILGCGAAGGVAAATVFAHMQGLPYSREILGNGAIGGLVITAIFHVQVLIAAINKSLGKSQIAISLSSRILGFHRRLLVMNVLSVFQLGLSFARTLFTALALVSRFHVRSKIFILQL